MHIDLNDEQRELRDELRTYFTDLMTAELEAEVSAGGEGGGPLFREAMQKLGAFFREEGLFTFVRWGSFMCNPPLCITEAQLREGFAIIDEALEVTHPYFEG